MFGGDLPSNDDFTLSLISNDEVLAVDQRGAHGGAFAEGGDSVVWTADGPGANEKYVAVFNVGEAGPIDVRVAWAALKLPERCVVRDLWTRKDIGAIPGGYTFRAGPHGSGIYKITAAKN
jgi:hypothetical protein